ncbi:MAG TPA: fatty acid cis/trans isomerase [Pseudomonadales bacterium]|nr:fatty acid cis/trans isomerase [Pseudomonadales bacterium]
MHCSNSTRTPRPRRAAPLRLVTALVACLFLSANTPAAAELPAPGHRLDYPADVRPILEQRCMVCHGCYDAPCQLKLDDWIGLERGGSKQKVYDGTRLVTANLTRLHEDALTIEGWREKGFHPVLDSSGGDADDPGVLRRMLALKAAHPLPTAGVLPDSFDFRLNRDQSCPRPDQMDAYEADRPLQGMPYGFPAIDADAQAVLGRWLDAGAPARVLPPPAADELAAVAAVETFLNGASLRQRLMARYIHEHLFTANLYFDALPGRSGWYKLVRSRTPPGEAIDLIATRRPFDDPGVDRFFYRLQQRHTAILDKRHMPYALGPARLQRWTDLFLAPDYEVTTLPAWDRQAAANPFATFAQLPVEARYRFMLDEAQFTIMGYIKGPVCRGQVALNVIDDQFWVAFVRPNSQAPAQKAAFLEEQGRHMVIPRPEGGLVVTLLQWREYAANQRRYLEARARKIAEVVDSGEVDVTLEQIWDGGPERNTNAALTVFRHRDSASVVRGFVGAQPKTMWVIDYSLLERIHYLLVAGFDVYGNAAHQLESRLYMDFLRMEGELNFLQFLPEARRPALREHWYRGAEDHVREFFVSKDTAAYARDTQIAFETEAPKAELMDMLAARIAGAREHAHRRGDGRFDVLADARGAFFAPLPEVAFVQVLNPDGSEDALTLVHNRGHSNIAHMFSEDDRLLPAEDTLTIARGFIGAYPNMFFQITAQQIPEFTAAILALDDDADYTRLVQRYGVRRTAPWFWRVSDRFVARYRELRPIEAGLFDLNRYENR